MADEDFSVFEQLDAREYDDYRFLLLGEARGVEHYIIKKFSFLRGLPVTRDFWLGIQQFSNMHKTIQLDGIEEEAGYSFSLCPQALQLVV